MKLEDFLQKEYNYNPAIKDAIRSYVEQWYAWYRGNVKKFHSYWIYNGERKIKQERYTMNMPKEISEDWSDILWSEKCEISLKDEKSQDSFNELVKELDLYTSINQVIEKSGALGTAGAVISVYNLLANEDGMYLDVSEAKTRIDLVDVENIYPLSWNNKEVTECAFGSVEYVGGNKYVILTVHKKNDNGNYIIYNHVFRDDNGQLAEVTDQIENTLPEFDTKGDIKWFSIFKPLLTNNLFNNSPFGIPHYANAIDNIKAVDIAFDELKNELVTGRRRIFARSEMFSFDNGQQKLVFDPNDTVIYRLPKNATKDDLIQSENDQLRTAQQIETLNINLNILGNKVGFGENHYHFDGTNLSTATAVVSSNSKMFRRKKKLEIGYEEAIRDLVNAICYASSTFGTYNINFEEFTVQFDDSIIEDKEAESNRAMREVSAGLLSKEEYREKIFGETEAIAEQEIKKIQEANPSIKDLLGTNDVKNANEEIKGVEVKKKEEKKETKKEEK